MGRRRHPSRRRTTYGDPPETHVKSALHAIGLTEDALRRARRALSDDLCEEAYIGLRQAAVGRGSAAAHLASGWERGLFQLKDEKRFDATGRDLRMVEETFIRRCKLRHR